MLMLATSLDLNNAQRILRENLTRPAMPTAELLQGKTVGIVGFGRIGQRIAEMLGAWGVALQAYDPWAKADVAGEIGRGHVGTPVTNAHLVCRLLLENKK